MIPALLVALASALPLASAHASIWHPSMWGFNVTDHTYPYDNRPVSPLSDMTFQQWWFHGHLDHPPNPGDVFQLPAGQAATTEIACNKGATTFFASSEGGDIRSGDDPCPGSPPSEYHTNGPDDLKGCSLAIAYKNDVNQVKPEDFSVFSVNNTCVFHRFTDFQVPARMPPCPEGGCICAWFWVHSQDSGGEQNYMNGFRCNITGSTSNVPVAKSQVPRRCGADPDNGKMQNAPGNCTYGAKQPFYWFQKEQNNMFEGTYAPPFYLPLYNFLDGAQNDIFEDSYPSGIPPPGPNSTVVPTPFLGGAAAVATLLPSQASLSSSIPSSSITPSSSLVPTSAVSLASASLTSVAPSTATVTSVLFVTITNTVTPSSTIASSTIQSQVTITNGVSGTPAASIQSPTPSVPISGTPIQLNNPSFSPLPSTVGVSQNETTGRQFAQLERVTGMGIDSNSSATSDTSSPASPLSTSATAEKASVCKRGSAPGLSKRSPPSFSKYIPGMRSHRRMQKRSSLWHLF